jgi:hypothetical protein
VRGVNPKNGTRPAGMKENGAYREKVGYAPLKIKYETADIE